MIILIFAVIPQWFNYFVLFINKIIAFTIYFEQDFPLFY